MLKHGLLKQIILQKEQIISIKYRLKGQNLI